MKRILFAFALTVAIGILIVALVHGINSLPEGWKPIVGVFMTVLSGFGIFLMIYRIIER